MLSKRKRLISLLEFGCDSGCFLPPDPPMILFKYLTSQKSIITSFFFILFGGPNSIRRQFYTAHNNFCWIPEGGIMLGGCEKTFSNIFVGVILICSQWILIF